MACWEFAEGACRFAVVETPAVVVTPAAAALCLFLLLIGCDVYVV